VEEEIRVKLPERRVRVTFRFRNDGPATKVLMAFPENGYLGGGATDKDLPKARRSNFGYFRTAVDGSPFQARLVKGMPEADGLGYAHWWVKEVPFAKGQTRTIVNEYQGGYAWGPPWSNVTGFSYVLRTGASWKGGKIGRTKVIVDARAIAQNGPIRFSPEGAKVVNSIYTWERTNFKPEDDVYVYWTDKGFLDVDVNGESLAGKWEAGEYIQKKWPVPVRRGTEVWVAPGLAAALTGAQVSGNEFVRANLRTRVSRDAKGLVPLTKVVQELGGTARWSGGKLVVTLPK
jgi:hypothetical protein